MEDRTRVLEKTCYPSMANSMIRTGSIWKQFEDTVGGEKILLVLDQTETRPRIMGSVFYSCLTSSGRVISLQGDFMFRNYYNEVRR